MRYVILCFCDRQCRVCPQALAIPTLSLLVGRQSQPGVQGGGGHRDSGPERQRTRVGPTVHDGHVRLLLSWPGQDRPSPFPKRYSLQMIPNIAYQLLLLKQSFVCVDVGNNPSENWWKMMVFLQHNQRQKEEIWRIAVFYRSAFAPMRLCLPRGGTTC